MDELDPVVEDLSTVDEKYHPLYVEKDGKFELAVTVKGMKPAAEVTRVHDALRKERNDHSSTKQKLQPFLSLGDLETVQAQLAKIPELELAAEGRIDDKKIDKIVEQRINTRLAPVQRERDAFKQQIDEKDGIIKSFETKEKTRTIHDQVRTAAKKAGVRDEAIEDAIMLGERVLEVTDDGTVVTKEGVGYTPGLDAQSLFTEIQPKRPHWFGESVGGGARGNSGGNTMQVNPFTAENWNLTEQGRIYNQDPKRAENLAKAAGTTIGGGRPPARRK